MNAPRPALVRCLLRASTLPLVLAVGALGMFSSALHEVATVARRAHEVDGEIALARARLAAETALANAGGAAGPIQSCDVAGVTLTVTRAADEFVVTCRAPDLDECELVGRDLPGGAPAALGSGRAAADVGALELLGGGLVIEPGAFPRLAPDARESAVSAVRLGLVCRDVVIALRHFAAGTDADDYRWCADELPGHGAGVGLISVPGHLWLAPDARPLTLRLEDDVVVLVDGNLYLGRSLLVEGDGRLLFVTTVGDGAVVYADKDGDGGWSAGDELREAARFSGCIEGGGACWLGLPGSEGELRCDAGLVVAGELQVSAPAEVAGPIVLRNGITDPAGHVAARGLGHALWGYRPARERIPGFEVSGPPRAGLLRVRSRR